MSQPEDKSSPGTEQTASSDTNAQPNAPLGNYTHRITVTGQTLDESGKPLANATIYIASQTVTWKRLAETTSDEKGNYTLSEIPLPIERADTTIARDHGRFIVYAAKQGHGFTWRPRKIYYVKRERTPQYHSDPDSDLPTRFFADDNIVLDLRFFASASIRGRVEDAAGNPLADTELSIWNAERVPPQGYRPQGENRFARMDNEGFELLNAEVPEEIKVRRTDEKGHFEFLDLPTGCRFRIKVSPPGFPSRMVWVTTQEGLDAWYGETPLYPASKSVDLVFGIPQRIVLRIIHGDTHQPAPLAGISIYNSENSLFRTTDGHGMAELSLPQGEYKVSLLPAYRTPYLEMETSLKIKPTAEATERELVLRPAAEVRIKVIDSRTGHGIAGVDLWKINALTGSKELHYTTSYEKATRIVHRDRERTDEKGVINALFEPGKHRIGVAMQAYPVGYRPREPNGKEVECQIGQPQEVVFRLVNRNPRATRTDKDSSSPP